MPLSLGRLRGGKEDCCLSGTGSAGLGVDIRAAEPGSAPECSGGEPGTTAGQGSGFSAMEISGSVRDAGGWPWRDRGDG